ncbi:hypothetical protein HYY75_00215 [bacterium]|nr:hypothetical protein [bacterium]
MAEKPTLGDIYRRNKPLFFVLPIAIALFAYNQFVLKPDRGKIGPLGRMPPDTTAPTPGSTPEAGTPIEGQPEPGEQNVPPPPPISTDFSSVPKIVANVEARFRKGGVYPHPEIRNIFLEFYKKVEGTFVMDVPLEQISDEPVAFVKPDISYHGFLNIGSEKVAILKLAGRLYLTRMGNILFDTPFVLRSILPSSVVLVDTGAANMEFEINLFEQPRAGAATIETASKEVPTSE